MWLRLVLELRARDLRDQLGRPVLKGRCRVVVALLGLEPDGVLLSFVCYFFFVFARAFSSKSNARLIL